jgi:hypothetical protein
VSHHFTYIVFLYMYIYIYMLFIHHRVDPKELEGRVIEHGQVVVRLGKFVMIYSVSYV